MPDYVAFVDDVTQELEQHEFRLSACSEDEAYVNAQEAFPHGVITAIVLSDELDQFDEMRRRAEKKRLQESQRLKQVWGNDVMKNLRRVGEL